MTKQRKPSSHDVMKHFTKRFYDKYGKEYNVSSYPKEMSLIKKQLLEPYGYEMSIKIVDAMVDNYEKWNPNPDFKLRVTSFTSIKWLQDKAIEHVENQENEKSHIEENVVVNKEKTKSALDRIMKRSKGGDS